MVVRRDIWPPIAINYTLYANIARRGTGVGLIKDALPAGEIVRTLRGEAAKVIEALKSLE